MPKGAFASNKVFHNCQMKSKGVTTRRKSLDEYILVLLFMLLLKRVHFLANKTWRCDHSNESPWSAHSSVAVYVITKESSFSCKQNLKVWPFKWKLINTYILMVVFVLFITEYFIMFHLNRYTWQSKNWISNRPIRNMAAAN